LSYAPTDKNTEDEAIFYYTIGALRLASLENGRSPALIPPARSFPAMIALTRVLRPEYLVRRLLQHHPEAPIHIQDEKQLAQLLREAAAAHHSFENTLGHSDENWPEWYAKHILTTLQGRHQETAAPDLRKEVKQ
jgi:hypothetical protein